MEELFPELSEANYQDNHKGWGEAADGYIAKVSEYTEEERNGLYQRLHKDILRKRKLLDQFNPQTPEGKVWLFERMCKDYVEVTEKFFNLVRELIENISSYPAALAQKITQALYGINRILFLSLLTEENIDGLILFWSIFENGSEQSANNKSNAEKLSQKIINFSKQNFTPQQCLRLIRQVNEHNQNRLDNNQVLEARALSLTTKIKNRLEKYERITLAGKSYFSGERRAVRRLLSALNHDKSLKYRQRLLKEALDGSDKETAKLVNEVLPNLQVKSNDGKRTYWINFDETQAVVIVPGQGKPHPDKTFHVAALPADAAERRDIVSKATTINEYFPCDIGGDFVVSDYVEGKDWSKYDGRVAPRTLPFVARLDSLCEKLRNLAEGKPPLEKPLPYDDKLHPYVWTRRELHRADDLEEKIHLLVPVIQHYLGVSDPLLNMNLDAVLRLNGVNEIEGEKNIQPEFKRIIGQFLARMSGDNDKRPSVQEILKFFECAKRYQKNNNQEEMEVLKLMGNSRNFEDDAYGLPKCPKARWLWFVELSDPGFYYNDPLKWRMLATHIANEKEKYTPLQRQFLRSTLLAYREKQHDRDDAGGEYQQIVAAAGSLFDEAPNDLFLRSEEKEALITLMEAIKKNNAWEEINAKINALQAPALPTWQEKWNDLNSEEKAEKVQEFKAYSVKVEEERKEFPGLQAELLKLIQLAHVHPNINFNNELVRKILLRLKNPPANILTILSMPAENRTPGQNFEMGEYLRNSQHQEILQNASLYDEIQKTAWNHDIALDVFCRIEGQERRKNMAEYIAENIFDYSGEQVIPFFNKLKEYELMRSLQLPGPLDRVKPPKYDTTELEVRKARDKIVLALKAYRNSLFYFNPKRLDISHVIAVLKDPSLQRNEAVLIDPEYARILDNVLRLIPLDVLNEFRQSTKPFKKYNQYELVRTSDGKVFAIDEAQCLGEGTFGSVFVANEVNATTGKFGKRVAVKFFNKDSTHAKILNEAKAVAKSFNVEGVVTDKYKTCLVMEYVKGKPIAKDSWSNGTYTNTADISTLPLAERFKAIVMLIAEMSTAHQHRNSGNAFLHFDIRLENVHIEISNRKVNDVRLLDFGLAAFIPAFYDPTDATFTTDGLGTRGFVAPEVKKTFKSDMRSLLPTILPLLGVYRLYNSQDIDARDAVKNYLLSGLLKGMEKELPLPLRAGLFQFILKMESYEDANSRPNDNEAFRFFNALYDYCRLEDKAAWKKIEYKEHRKLLKGYREIIPKNAYRWFQHLKEMDNPDDETTSEIQRAAEMVYGQIDVDLDIGAKLALLRYFVENDKAPNEKNRARWESLVKAIAATHALPLEDFVSFAGILNSKRKNDKVKGIDTVFKMGDGDFNLDAEIFEKFVLLSKTENYASKQDLWESLARIIVENLDKYAGAQLITLLRKINKFNGKNEYEAIRDVVKTKLNAQWGDACKAVMDELHIPETGISWNRSAVKDLEDAIKGQCFWSRNNRRYLKNAVSESPNQAVDAVVRKLGKAVDVGA